MSMYQKIIFHISQPKHMLWVLKRTVSTRQFFWAPESHVKIDKYEKYLQMFAEKLCLS